MINLKGNAVSEKIQSEIQAELMDWKSKKIPFPQLTVILVGNDPASEVYVAHKEKMCRKLGFESQIIKLSQTATEKELKDLIMQLNKSKSVDGILVQLPLPAHMNSREILEIIDPSKDVDCLTESNLGKVLTGRALVQPCTPSGIIEILKFYDIPLKGKNVAIVGRSLIVGIPLIHLFLKENASVSIFHSHSTAIEKQLRTFDIVCVAIGKAGAFKYSQFKSDAVVIDVGINRGPHGLSGDIENDSVQVYAATPVPGGVGVMTIAMLMKNTLALARQNRKIL